MKAEEARHRVIAFKSHVRDGRDARAEKRAAHAVWNLQDAFDYYLGTYAQARRLAASDLDAARVASDQRVGCHFRRSLVFPDGWWAG
jgi:hypothetical protein